MHSVRGASRQHALNVDLTLALTSLDDVIRAAQTQQPLPSVPPLCKNFVIFAVACRVTPYKTNPQAYAAICPEDCSCASLVLRINAGTPNANPAVSAVAIRSFR